MSKNAKKKLCWSCEGRVPREAENCPYCGVYLSPNVPEVVKTSTTKPLAPPYTIPSQTNPKALAAPYQPQNADETGDSSTEETITSTSDIKSVLTPLVLLLAGTVLFIFGAALYLFSHNGVLTLRWNAEFWPYYFGIAVPMLVWGWLSLSKLKDNSEELTD